MLGRRFAVPVVAAALVALAVALRYLQIGEQSLRVDEAWQVWMAGMSPLEQLRIVSAWDVHPPLSYVLQSGWQVFGSSDTAVRSMSALASVGAMLVVFVLGRRVGGLATGAGAALLIAVSPWHIQHSNDARMYTLASLMTALVLLGAVAVLHRDREQAGWRSQLPYFLAGVGGVYTENSVGVTVGMCGLVVLVLLWTAGRTADARRWIATNAGIGVVWAMWWPGLFQQSSRLDSQLTWIPDPTAQQVHAMLRAPYVFVFDGAPTWAAGWWIDVLAVGVMALGAWRLKRVGVLLVAALVAVPAAALAVSTQAQILTERLFLPSSIPAYVLLAAGAVVLGRVAGTAVLVGAVAISAVGIVAYVDRYQLSEFERAARIVESTGPQNNAVVYVSNYGALPFWHYADLGATEQIGLPADFDDLPKWENPVTEQSLSRLDPVTGRAGNIWLVYVREHALDPELRTYQHLLTTHVATECVTLRGIDLVRFSPIGQDDAPSCSPF